MIVRSDRHPLLMLFTLRGSVLPDIAGKLAIITALAFAAAWMWHTNRALLPDLAAAPFGVVGVAISIILGFRNAACYDRWWEGRRQWGQLVVELRCFARDVMALLPPDTVNRTRLIHAAIGYAHALHLLLRPSAPADAAHWLPPEVRDAIANSRNPPNAILLLLTRDLAHLRQEGALSDITYTLFDARLTAMSSIGTACERIRSTPTPFAYTLLVHRITWMFCLLLPFGLAGSVGWFVPLLTFIPAYAFFGLDALGDQLERPFGTTMNALALGAMVRGIEIDLLETLGETDLPKPLTAERRLLL